MLFFGIFIFKSPTLYLRKYCSYFLGTPHLVQSARCQADRRLSVLSPASAEAILILFQFKHLCFFYKVNKSIPWQKLRLTVPIFEELFQHYQRRDSHASRRRRARRGAPSQCSEQLVKTARFVNRLKIKTEQKPQNIHDKNSQKNQKIF